MAGLTVPEEVQKQIEGYLKQKGYGIQYCVLYYDYWDCDFAVVQLKDGSVEVVLMEDKSFDREVFLEGWENGTTVWVLDVEFCWKVIIHDGKELKIYNIESLVELFVKGLSQYTPMEVIELT